MSQDNIEALKAHVNRLKELLDAPHPGLHTWCLAYGNQMRAISDFWNCDSPKPDSDRLDWLAQHVGTIKTSVAARGSTPDIECSVELQWWRGRVRMVSGHGPTLAIAMRQAIDAATQDTT